MAAPRNAGRLVLGAGAVVVVLAVAYVAANLWLGSGEAATAFEPSEDLRSEANAGANDSPDSSGATDGVVSEVAAGLEGTWTVQSREGADAGVGYRVLEDLPVGGPEEVVARSTAVVGSATIADAVLDDAEFVVQLDGLRSGNDLRDGIVASDFLEVPQFPTATLTVSDGETLALPDAAGELDSFVVRGELSIHGVTQPVTVNGQGQWQPGLVEILGTIDITLGQFGVDRPSLLGRSTRDEAVVEFKVQLVPAEG